jgi:hypothetical protein
VLGHAVPKHLPTNVDRRWKIRGTTNPIRRSSFETFRFRTPIGASLEVARRPKEPPTADEFVQSYQHQF